MLMRDAVLNEAAVHPGFYKICTVCPELVITGPPTHSVGGGQTSNGRWCLSLLSVTLHGGPAGGFTPAGQAMTSCGLQSNYSCTAGQ